MVVPPSKVMVIADADNRSKKQAWQSFNGL